MWCDGEPALPRWPTYRVPGFAIPLVRCRGTRRSRAPVRARSLSAADVPASWGADRQACARRDRQPRRRTERAAPGDRRTHMGRCPHTPRGARTSCIRDVADYHTRTRRRPRGGAKVVRVPPASRSGSGGGSPRQGSCGSPLCARPDPSGPEWLAWTDPDTGSCRLARGTGDAPDSQRTEEVHEVQESRRTRRGRGCSRDASRARVARSRPSHEGTLKIGISACRCPASPRRWRSAGTGGQLAIDQANATGGIGGVHAPGRWSSTTRSTASTTRCRAQRTCRLRR